MERVMIEAVFPAIFVAFAVCLYLGLRGSR
jgi:hypothetical protein